MKRVLLISVLASQFMLLPPVSSANDNISLRICEYVAANDKSRLRSYLKQNKLKLRDVYDKINCNGENLLVFSAANAALETGEFIIGKTSVKEVTANIAAIAKYSKHLEEAAKERIK
ncbi:DUF3718 domain-containing protein [Thalassotalea piscium]|uniref:Putative phosphosugar-binding protein n=1 Tax=Thalassotalea piscium TaxID=1230533 RepID=A0A7X0NIL6_9GAMM|nr:DUF3718 domain-containing protein [Thalassotalea piscium]MBB6544143.1 putative phosphosugar-binding protein [Thalassotalea piscium]